MTNWQMELMLFSFIFLLPVVCSQRDPEWPWSQAYVKHNAMAGTGKGKLSLATVVLHENEVFSKHEIDQSIDIVEPDSTPQSSLVALPLSETPDNDTLLSGLKNLPLDDELWDNALSRYTASTETLENMRDLNLSTLVIQGSEVYSRDKWSWKDSLQMAKLEAATGKKIQISCRVINGSAHHRPTVIETIHVDSTKPDKYNTDCYKIIEPNSDCWHNFTFIKPIIVYCIWGYRGTELLFEFMIDSNTSEPVEMNPKPTPPQTSKGVATQPSISLTPYTFNIGPYAIKHTGQQQILFNPTYSLKRVELSMQINISVIKPTCSPFLSTSYAGWSAWLGRRTVATSQRLKREVTGILGTGLGVLNSIDAEILANKLVTTTSDLDKLKYPLQSSLSALGNHQWLLSNILPQWEEMGEKDHQLITNALGTTQNNVSLALSCTQAQLWMQSMTAAIIREGEEGTLPTEIRKVIWDNAIEFERKFQSWWYLVNFTYDPTESKATAFVLTIRNASVYTIYPIIALGLNHHGAILHPVEHRVWAQQNENKWQTVDVEACISRDQQGFICERNTLKAQDICLDTNQNVCHFEIQPDETPETVLVYIGKGCVCMRSPCTFVFVDDIAVDISNNSNLCVCNFTNIIGCDFSYSAPVTSFQLLQSNYTLIRDLLPTPIGMNLSLVKKLLEHDELKRLLKEAQENGQRTLITVHHDVEEIHHVLERVKRDGGHEWWDTLFGWSPTATGLFNKMLHPVVVLLVLTVLCFALTIVLYVRLWIMMKRLTRLITPQEVFALDIPRHKRTCDIPHQY
ncbi:uncharacterized protein LOC134508994 isoform X1 [Chroicocephalus ridibundus]|uniref:uncharacterized protein LOC134508994 isoform X1 n=1 Tax=Chroicocephalus ridibundus TaxID=1192867 RepID=UPI002FDD2C37